MPIRRRGGGGGGGVLGLGPAQNTFGDQTTADRAAAETLRNTYATANAAWLTQYNNDLGFWIRLVWNGGVAEQRRNAGGTAWEDVTNVIRGQTGMTGPGPTQMQIDTAVQTGVKPYARTGGPSIAPSDAASAFMLDTEFTAAAVRNLLNLTPDEVNNLLTGAAISGRVITIPRNEGPDITITLPADMVGTPDGVVQSGTISANGQTLRLVLSVGGPIDISIPAILRQAGVTETRVGELIVAGVKEYARIGERGVRVGDMDSQSATSGQVPTADGSMGVAWADQQGAPPPQPHQMRRYAALRADGSTASDFTAADFLAGEHSDTQDIDTPASNVDQVVGIAVPMAEGLLTGVAELDANGNVNPLAMMIRANFAPAVGATPVELDIQGVAHYVYATTSVVFAVNLGVIGYRLTQTP